MRGPLFLSVAAIMGVAIMVSSAVANEGRIPVPTGKPTAAKTGRPYSGEITSQAITSGGITSQAITGTVPSATAPVSADLKSGLDALSDRQPDKAIAIRERMRKGTLDRHILSWAIAVSGQRGIPSLEIARTQRELQGWPGLKSLRAHSERALYREDPPAAAVIAAFGATRPETAEGAIVLARAFTASGKTVAAAERLRAVWFEDTLDKDTEDSILSEFPGLLMAADHKRRMEMLLYRDRVEQAERFGALGKAQSLYRAWAAVIRGNGKAADLIAAVDQSWHADPAYLFLRIEYLRKQEKYEEAAMLLARMPRESDALANPGAWWTEQRIVSRGLLHNGDFRGAYRVAANHAATDATDIVDAEFHAGWYALRALEDPATAARHFRRILDASRRPISASRAWYWLGRAAEAGGPGASADYFA
ncbi:MAG TPA: lytic transglycosylase domain-containing protein, partial [Sinorhizobium sp.]|nr:lytic transglycosylase domain-containing protein [Sinorhizobium sp.]